MLLKLTGNARADILEQLFENPKIIWLDREPEAVVFSYYKQRWGYKDKPAVFEQKPKEALLLEYVNKYQMFQMDKKELDRFEVLEIQYEAFVNNPEKSLKEMCEFLNLKYTSAFQQKLKKYAFNRNTNQAYHDTFSETDRDLVRELLQKL